MPALPTKPPWRVQKSSKVCDCCGAARTHWKVYATSVESPCLDVCLGTFSSEEAANLAAESVNARAAAETEGDGK